MSAALSELSERMQRSDLNTIARYIRQHSFPATVHDDFVSFTVPTTLHGQPAEDARFEVRTFNEARAALGY